MSDHEDDKIKSPFDSELEDETIALSTDELDSILTDAESIQDTAGAGEGPPSEETSISEGIESAESETTEFKDDFAIGTEPDTESLEEGEFDISGEIDELSPEDLENIEIEENEVDAYTMELESELEADEEKDRVEEEAPAEGGIEESIEDDFADIETEGIMLEANMDEEMDLDTYLDSVKSDIDFESTDLKEAGKEEEPPLESPVFGDTEDITNIEADAEEAFNEAGIEGIANELDTAGIDIDEGGVETEIIEEDRDEMPLEEESVPAGEATPSEGTEAGEFQLDVGEDLEITDEPPGDEIVVDEGLAAGEEGEAPEEEALGAETEITEEESGGKGLEISEEEPVLAGTDAAEEERVGVAAEGMPAGEEEPSIDIDESDLQLGEDMGEGEPFEDEVVLTEEEESILSADIDLEEQVTEEQVLEEQVLEEGFEGTVEEVVTVTGEELNSMTGEDTAAEETGDLEESAVEEGIESEVEGTAAVLSEELNITTDEEAAAEETVAPEEGAVTEQEIESTFEERAAVSPDLASGAIGDEATIDSTLYNDISVILKYMDNLLGDLPEEKIKEFSQSKYFSLYKEVFEKLNLT
jgi:hypothetical protein